MAEFCYIENTTVEATVFSNNIIEATIDESQNIVETTVSPQTIVEAEVVGGMAAATAENLGSGVGVYAGSVEGLLQLKSLICSDSTIMLSADGEEIDITSNLPALIQVIELAVTRKLGVTDYYVTATKNVDGDYTKIEMFSDPGKTTKLFTQTFTLVDGNCTQITVVDETTGITMVQPFSFDEDGDPITWSITHS